jgi:hypothetical protein
VITIRGQKVLSVGPGMVYSLSEGGWHYSILVNYRAVHCREYDTRYASAADAKQAMRENVAALRKQHMMGE